MSLFNLLEHLNTSAPPNLELTDTLEQGLPLETITRLKEEGLTFSEVAEVVIAPRTLKHRKARGERLSSEETDRVVRVARMVALAAQVFGNHDKGMAWLRLADERLGGRTPLSMLHTEFGGRMIENMLWQIDEGVYA